MAEVILTIMVIYVTMVYGPIAAFLVEMFATKIRFISMSLPYHIGNGWFGGVLPLVATALVAAYGDIYAGLWYPIIAAVMTFGIGSLLLVQTKDVDIVEGSDVEAHLRSSRLWVGSSLGAREREGHRRVQRRPIKGVEFERP